VIVVNCPKEISSIYVSSFQGVGSAILLASSTSMLYKMKVTLIACEGGRNSSAVWEEVVGHRPHPTNSIEDGPAASSKRSCVSSLWSVGSVCFIADCGRLRLYTPTQEFQDWVETLCKGHEAYGFTEKRLLEKCTNVRSELMITGQKLKLWSKEAAILESGKNEVAERLQGKKTASMGKYGTPATKAMEIWREEKHGRSSKRTRS